MRVAVSTRSVRMVQGGIGWTSGLRLVDEVTGGPGKGDSILEGEPAQFEALYDQLNQASLRLSRTAARVREAIGNGAR